MRSIAALGMVAVLQREGLVPDLVVGCSAGAMLGALIATGHNADEAVRIATRLWSADVTHPHRWRAIAQMLWPRLRPGARLGRLSCRSGSASPG